MRPVIVTRSTERIAKGKLSTVFTARFSDGSEKMLRMVRKDAGVVLDSEIGANNAQYLPIGESPLYFLDWSLNPIFGDFKKDYPKKR